MIEAESNPVQITKSGIPIRNLWHMLLYVWDAVHLQSEWKSDVEASPTLDSLLATILSNLIQQRLRIGLGRDYRSFDSEIAGVRGRVDFNQSLKRLSFQHGRAHCHYQVFSANVPKNQIVRSTIARLVQIGQFGKKESEAEKLKARLRRLVLDMEMIDLIELKATNIRREQLQRHDLDYRLMLAICNLLYRRQLPTEERGIAGFYGLDRDAYTLYDIYEKFVARFYAHHLKDWSVFPQQKLVWPATETCVYLPVMFPDLTLQHRPSGHLIVLDTKFTAKILVTGRWGNQTFNRDHLFQIYSYLKSQENQSESHKSSTGILLYPTVNHDFSELINVQGHALRWETVDLSRSWKEVEEELLAIPENAIQHLSSH